MKIKSGIIMAIAAAVGGASLLAGCEARYYDHDRYHHDGYYHRDGDYRDHHDRDRGHWYCDSDGDHCHWNDD